MWVLRYGDQICPSVALGGNCPQGDLCGWAHCFEELAYHPARFKTKPCDQSGRCRGRVCVDNNLLLCTYAHNTSEDMRQCASLYSYACRSKTWDEYADVEPCDKPIVLELMQAIYKFLYKQHPVGDDSGCARVQPNAGVTAQQIPMHPHQPKTQPSMPIPDRLKTMLITHHGGTMQNKIEEMNQISEMNSRKSLMEELPQRHHMSCMKNNLSVLSSDEDAARRFNNLWWSENDLVWLRHLGFDVKETLEKKSSLNNNHKLWYTAQAKSKDKI